MRSNKNILEEEEDVDENWLICFSKRRQLSLFGRVKRHDGQEINNVCVYMSGWGGGVERLFQETRD